MRSMSQCFNIVYLAIGFTAGQLPVLNGQTACALGYPFTPNGPRRLPLAPLRHAAGRWMCPFIEEERKWSTRGQNDAFDPTRTSAVRLALNADSGPTPAKDYCL